MSVEIKVPVLPESVADATIATWHKQPGEPVAQDENLVDIETDKVVLEVAAPGNGVIEKIIKAAGATVGSQEVIAIFKIGGTSSGVPAAASTAVVPAASTTAAPVASTTVVPAALPSAGAVATGGALAPPAVRRMLGENNLTAEQVPGSGKGGRITKQDVQAKLQQAIDQTVVPMVSDQRTEKRVPMTRLRARIAERLVTAQQTAAILTTFNEVNMQPVMELRNNYKKQFEEEHGVRLGFMSFFVTAAVEALRKFPAVNASIDGKDIVYHGFCDVGIAVSSPRGLVVPILRNCENLSMAEVEKQIRSYGEKAASGGLSIEDMTGGTFTISNGGVFGSLLSTPILNPPQSAILGMHKIQERVVVENGQMVVRPMMYLALSYDHRIIDGADSVKFLLTIKEILEEPARMLLGV